MKKNKNPHRGSTFDSYLREEGIYAEATAVAQKEVFTLQIKEIMRKKHINQAEMAKRMEISSASLRQLFNRHNETITLLSMIKMADAIGKRIEVRIG